MMMNHKVIIKRCIMYDDNFSNKKIYMVMRTMLIISFIVMKKVTNMF